MGKRRNRWIAAVALVVVVAAVVVVVVTSKSGSSNGSNSTPSYTGAATVQRRNLVSTDTESGTLSYANPQTVYNSLYGLITWLPTAGQVIKPGGTLFKVGNSPVILMNGSTPAYRTLDSSDSPGPDILELNRNLVDLGYESYLDIDDEWQANTTYGVERLQEAMGWDVTGSITLGQIVFLPGRQMVASVVGALGSGTPASTAGSSSSGKNGSSSSSSSDDGNTPTGGAQPAEILTTTSTQLVATVDLSASLQSEATLGEKVSVEMPDGSYVNGTVTAVSPVASSDSGDDDGGDSGGGDDGSGDSGSSTVPVTIALDRRVDKAGLDQAAVSVNFTQAKANHVLSVPVTALIATSGQNFAVQETTPPHKLIPVTTGLFAAGYVEISGPGIYSGLQVTDSQG